MRRRLLIPVLSMGLVALLTLASCVITRPGAPAASTPSPQQQGGIMGGMMGGRDYSAPRTFGSNGERIYYTGLSSSGRLIPFRGGPMWLGMHGGSCASCHGTDGRGGVPVMMGTAVPSDISYWTLTGEEAHSEDGHAHEAYTDELIKRAIAEGRDPEGQFLDSTMPRWQMSEKDLNDLIEYLKTFARQGGMSNGSQSRY